jgi:hypothetical protein
MKTVLHDDNVERGLYPLNSLEKEVIRSFSLQIVQQVVCQSKLPVLSESFDQVVCDAC